MRALALATAVAVVLASAPAWGHTFPAVRQVVVQIERCEVVLLVGYRPGSGEATEAILARVAGVPKPRALDALRDVLGTAAMAPLVVSIDGKRLVPNHVQAKVALEPGGARPMVVLLVTYAAPAGGALAISTKDPRNTRISWHDRESGRAVISAAPAQGTWHRGVASFLLELGPPTGGPACGATRSSPSDLSSPRAR